MQQGSETNCYTDVCKRFDNQNQFTAYQSTQYFVILPL